MKERVGMFKISDNFYKDTKRICSMFGVLEFAPTKCEHIFIGQYFEMTGYSPYFEEIEEGMNIPRYEIVVTEEKYGQIEIDAQKIELAE